MQNEKSFDAVIHTASPFHYNVQDNEKDLLRPAVDGTIGILSSLKKYGGSSVKRVAITSSFAAMFQSEPPAVYNEECWNLDSWENAVKTTNPQVAYRGSKALAERAAWRFMEEQQPLPFKLTVLCPPFVFGPIEQELKSLESINTSNKRLLNIVQGKKHEGPIGSSIYVDVRDLAEAHVRAVEPQYPEAQGKRFFMTAGTFSDAYAAEIILQKFPSLAGRIDAAFIQHLAERATPMKSKVDNGRSKEILKMEYRPVEETITDVVRSLLEHGA